MLAGLALAGSAGCGAAASSAAGGTSTAPAGAGATPTGVTPAPTPTAPPTPTSAAGACAAAGAAPGASVPGVVTLGRADDGHTVCVTTGTVVRVVMQAANGRPWRFAVEGDALVAAPQGREALPQGSQVASYRAARPGSARITGTRVACPPPRPGEVACMAIEQAWGVTVEVS